MCSRRLSLKEEDSSFDCMIVLVSNGHGAFVVCSFDGQSSIHLLSCDWHLLYPVLCVDMKTIPSQNFLPLTALLCLSSPPTRSRQSSACANLPLQLCVRIGPEHWVCLWKTVGGCVRAPGLWQARLVQLLFLQHGCVSHGVSGNCQYLIPLNPWGLGVWSKLGPEPFGSYVKLASIRRKFWKRLALEKNLLWEASLTENREGWKNSVIAVCLWCWRKERKRGCKGDFSIHCSSKKGLPKLRGDCTHGCPSEGFLAPCLSKPAGLRHWLYTGYRMPQHERADRSWAQMLSPCWLPSSQESHNFVAIYICLFLTANASTYFRVFLLEVWDPRWYRTI